MSESRAAVTFPYAYVYLPDILPLALVAVQILEVLVKIHKIREIYQLIQVFEVVVKAGRAAAEGLGYAPYGQGLRPLGVYDLKSAS